jgi:hypothetical protein
VRGAAPELLERQRQRLERDDAPGVPVRSQRPREVAGVRPDVEHDVRPALGEHATAVVRERAARVERHDLKPEAAQRGVERPLRRAC